ncbi:Kinesin-related protein 12 [Mactra antiquata]
MTWFSSISDELDDIYDENDPREKLILSLKREIKVLRNENHYLKQQLEFPAKPKGQIQKENDQKMAKFMKETNGKPETNNTVNHNDEKLKNGSGGGTADESGLYEMLQEYMVENEALRTENAEMQVNRDKVRQDQQSLYRDNERLMRRVDDLERRLNQAQVSWQAMPRQGSHQSREHSPRGSPQYRAVGSGGKGQARFPPPPNDLPLRDNPALRDHVYPGSPPQAYNNSPSGTGNGRRQQPSPGRQQPSPSRNQPMKPPHRLADTIPQQRPVNEQNGPPYMNGHPGGHPAPHPAMHPAQTGPYRQAHIGSPNRPNDLRMDSRRSSQSTSSDAIRDMNEKLKQELMQLDGEIHHHQVINHHRTNNAYGSQGSMR